MSGQPVESGVSERDLFAPPVIVTGPAPPVRPAPARAPGPRLGPVLARQAGLVRAALTLEYERGALALLIPVALGGGALLYLAAPAEPAWPAPLLGLAALAAARYAARDRPLAAVAIAAALLVLVGFAAAKLEAWRAGTQVLGGEISTRITGRVVDIDHLSNRRVRLVLDVLSTERPQLRYAPQRVRVSAPSLPDGVTAGSTVAGLVRLQPPPGPIRPGGYDFSFESYFDGIGANGFFMGAPRLASAAEPVPVGIRFRAILDNARNAIAGRVRAAIGGAEGEIAAALIVGVRAGIPEDVNEALRRTGLAHILSISGLHMALVAASVMVAMRLGMALVPGFVAAHPTKKYAAAAALLVLSAYLLVSGAEVAAQRSFIMIAVMLTAVLFDRQALTMRNLAISAIIILLVSPHEIAGPSFQMSFAATAALIGGYAAWSQYRRAHPPRHVAADAPAWRRALRWWWLVLAGTAATAVIAGLATSIYGVWHFQRVSPLTLFANLAATPFVSLIVMPFGLLAMLAMPFGLDGPLLAVMGKGLSAMLAIADYLSARSPVDAVGLVTTESVVLLTIALLLATMATTRLRLLALPALACGLLLIPPRALPDVFVSEDARLVGLRGEEGALLVNRERPNRFTSEGWQRALAAPAIVKPVVEAVPKTADAAGKEGTATPPSGGEAVERLDYAAAQEMVAAADADRFHCKGPLCVARHGAAGVVAVAEDAWTAQQVCRAAALVVVRQARARSTCADGRANILTARSLARHGAATVSFGAPQGAGSSPTIKIEHAVAEPYRPWHRHRQFSRAARGMEPFQPRRRAPQAAPKPALPADPAVSRP